jgi:hypothetical protein
MMCGGVLHVLAVDTKNHLKISRINKGNAKIIFLLNEIRQYKKSKELEVFFFKNKV